MPTPKLTSEQLEMFNAFFKNWLMPKFLLRLQKFRGLLVLIPKTTESWRISYVTNHFGILAHHFHHDPAGIVPGLVFENGLILL